MTISSLTGLDVGWLGMVIWKRSLERGAKMYDQFDVSLEDVDLLGEVELTTNLIIAASEAEDRLSTSEIDQILGVVPEPPQPRRES
jgi:hypothetical protein